MASPFRLPILYLILGVLILVSVVPLYFYATQVVGINREQLKTQEQVLQNTITGSLAEDISQRQSNLRTMLSNLASAILVTSGSNLTGEHVSSPELRALLEKFVSSSPDIAYATILNDETKGISAGRIALDDFIRRELEHAFAAARDGRPYNGQALEVGAGKERHTVMLVSTPLMADGRFIGMISTIVDLNFLTKRLKDAATGGLLAYVVDRNGRLVAGANQTYAVGQDMTKIEIVKNFVDLGGKTQVRATKEFQLDDGNDAKEKVAMLGTYSPVPALEWAVVAQKTQRQAYQGVFEMQRTANFLAAGLVVIILLLSVIAARKITHPIDVLTSSSRAIAKGDFSQRVHLKSRTEIGELAATFNVMTGDLERMVFDLKKAAEENRALFMSSIQMLAGAVDEKDPYTKGHSDRVTRYSVILATELALMKEDIEKIRISAQLHDVGKIGIEDRILKKPGALTPDEFEIMKTHTSKGATILRPVEMLKEMIPGIELHHESLDGRGYPHGLKGDDIPLMPRVITVADTFDAMTTNRPYQAAMDPEYVVRIINSLANTKFDPRVVAALTAVFEGGKLRLHRAATVSADQAAAAAAAAASAAPAIVETMKS
ncbi:MAG: HD domain-containing protein [Candidatus Koribacter versatilis]|uniref:HD domain-containing protein n=1 Tax=Candidatus Korobacter versatilis TaxID=658062 RepID=A0A932A6K8_9BACT|nr:HD domain-containing protein [Candidatus Koribacter versatilis]